MRPITVAIHHPVTDTSPMNNPNPNAANRSIACPQCGQQLSIPANLSAAKCPKCNATFQVGTNAPTASPNAPAQNAAFPATAPPAPGGVPGNPIGTAPPPPAPFLTQGNFPSTGTFPTQNMFPPTGPAAIGSVSPGNPNLGNQSPADESTSDASKGDSSMVLLIGFGVTSTLVIGLIACIAVYFFLPPAPEPPPVVVANEEEPPEDYAWSPDENAAPPPIVTKLNIQQRKKIYSDYKLVRGSSLDKTNKIPIPFKKVRDKIESTSEGIVDRELKRMAVLYDIEIQDVYSIIAEGDREEW
ncbi:MAG: hypothetical protein AAFP90_14770 [Planctomycetota bacterium]